MQFSPITITLFASLAAAVPAVDITKRQLGLCSSALDTAQCYDVSVDGIANLNSSPAPANITDFESTCSASGQTAYCCTLPLAGDALLCTAV